MKIRQTLATLGAVGILTAGAMAGMAPTAQAASSPCTASQVPEGTMCVHVYNVQDGAYHWLGPWSSCITHEIPYYEFVTWIRSQQTGNAESIYWDSHDKYLGYRDAYFYGRPPGYVSREISPTAAIRVC